MDKPIISMEKVNKAFLPGVQVIDNLSFSVQKGEIIGILGPNGAGKTTTIRLLNGVLYPDTGRMSVAGFDPVSAGDEVRKRCGVLTESAGLYEHMTARDNLLFFAELYGVPEPVRQAERLLSEFGLAGAARKKVGTFSTGMKKRLGIAKALLHNPEILFLDEPTTGLDPEGSRALLNYIKELNRECGVTILLATHLLKQVQDFGHRFLFIEQGRLLESGSFVELETKYLREITLKVETGLAVSGDDFAGFPVVKKGPGYLWFRLESKNAVPLLLEKILAVAPVYSAVITGRDLETIYFIIREEKQ
ncbi:MAG TPA: ABC transporter ATP-binding protein [Firmicutes bacterium]|jgi:ABC-2 type transport system ATP-binding protein|nr:ABC transporter ATP-binding protein [Bacillota bacterium]